MIKYIIQASKDGKFYFEIIGRNGEPMSTSEMVDEKRNVLKSILSIILGHNPIFGTKFKIIDVPEQTVKTYPKLFDGSFGNVHERKFNKKEREKYV